MRDDHPAEQYRAEMAGLDADPPPVAPPSPRPVVVVLPPERFDWAALWRVLLPALPVLVLVVLLLHRLL